MTISERTLMKREHYNHTTNTDLVGGLLPPIQLVYWVLFQEKVLTFLTNKFSWIENYKNSKYTKISIL